MDRLLGTAALIVWLVTAAIQLAFALPLKHDEAAYLIGAERLLAGEPAVWLYRSIGTELLAVPGIALGGSITTIRILPALVTLLVPIGAWRLARAVYPDRALGGWAAAVLAGAHPMILQNASVLGDLPAAGLVVVGCAVLVRELSRPDGASWRIAGAAPLLVAAFYVRYGSVPALLAIAVASVIVYGRAIVRRPLPVIATVALALILVVPHVVASLDRTGSVLGILRTSAASTRFVYAGEGLVTYLTENPFAYYGYLAAPVVAIGIVAGIALRDRRAGFVALVGIATLAILGWKSHAQPRYAFAVVALLVVVGVGGVARALELAARPRPLVIASVAAIAVCWIAALGWTISTARARDAREPFRELAQQIAHDAAGRPCMIVAAREPQLAYYSGCEGEAWPSRDVGRRRVYVVSLPGRPQEPAFIAAGAPYHPLPGADGVVVIDQPR
ncbi:MAG TPA: hypothetical protein VFQ53_22830 [Kofleriaceae bacterium]|nr:hypothetical protein [Kofleriaceae bacterium]